ncbi:hypothetical protein BCR44DRAFT_1393291, partial [Catenaria anguillulae PL171]
PQDDLQAIALAHRIGQPRPVLAYQLATLDSVAKRTVEIIVQLTGNQAKR